MYIYIWKSLILRNPGSSFVFCSWRFAALNSLPGLSHDLSKRAHQWLEDWKQHCTTKKACSTSRRRNQPARHPWDIQRSMWIKTCGCTQRKPKVVKLFVLVFPRKDQDFDSLWLSLCVCPRFHFDIMKWFNISPCRIRVFVSLDARNLNKEASTTHISWSRGHPM